MPGLARTPIVEARGKVLTDGRGILGLGYELPALPAPKTTTLGKSPNDPKVPSTRQGRICGQRIKAPRRDGGGFFRWWIFCPSPTSSPPPIQQALVVALVGSCAVGAYRRRGPNGPRDHDGAPQGGWASQDRTGRAFSGVDRLATPPRSAPLRVPIGICASQRAMGVIVGHRVVKSVLPRTRHAKSGYRPDSCETIL